MAIVPLLGLGLFPLASHQRGYEQVAGLPDDLLGTEVVDQGESAHLDPSEEGLLVYVQLPWDDVDQGVRMDVLASFEVASEVERRESD